MNERELRHSSYIINSSKETREREFFDNFLTKYFNITKWIHHPEDSWYNKAGNDCTAWFGNIKRNLDFKGFNDEFDTVCLSYARSYDGVKWFDTLYSRVTTDYIFIDVERNACYILTKSKLDEMRNTPEIWGSFKKVTVEPERAGHWQKAVLIPKELLYKVDL